MDYRQLKPAALGIAMLLAATLACGPATPDGGPTASIASPASGATVTAGEEVQITTLAAADAGIARIELSVGRQMIRSDEPPEGHPTVFSVVQPWIPLEEGQAVVSVVAYDADGAASDPATINLFVVAAAAAITPTPVDDVEGPGGCTLNASYAADVTVPDDTEIPPGQTFVKTWRIRNSGNCDWGPGFSLLFVSGDRMGGPISVPVPPTAAGSTADISVDLVAPAAPGTYRGNWRLQSDEELGFGSTVYVRIVVPAPATNTPAPTVAPTVAPPPTAVPLAAPTNLVKSVLLSGYVSLVWTDNATGEDGYHVLADGAIFLSAGPDAVGHGFQYGDHFCGQTVQLTVVAYRGAETSAPSNAVSHTGPPCAPPVVVQASGVVMALPSYLDLDTGALGAYDANVDLLWQSSGGYRVIGMNGMRFADVGIGGDVPSYVGCSSASRTETAIYTPELQAGSRLCFNTTAGNMAGFYVQEIQADNSLIVSYTTWEGSP